MVSPVQYLRDLFGRKPANAPVAAKAEPSTTTPPAEPQTAQLTSLHREVARHPARGLTPSRLANILDAAENGDVVAQYELFEDMEEKDAHILAEMGKRRRALLSVGWDVQPPPRASAAEKKAAEGVKELLGRIKDFESVLFDLTDAIGKGFSCLELEWTFVERQHRVASLSFRPQSWFKLHRSQRQQEIRLRDNSADGAPLWPFGWVVHSSKAKSGWLERAALFRALVWPYLFKNYSVGDLAEFLEIYGIPVRIGKYHSTATEKEKLTLLRALASISHNASGIIPEGMSLDFLDAATGDPKAFELMIDWCERSQSKAILGATLTSQADRGSNTNALGNVHNEVRKDLRDGDAKQLASTLTRDLLYPLAALNFGITAEDRAPVFVFDLDEGEDLKLYSEALPPLVDSGLLVPVAWAHEKLRIPLPKDGEAVLQPRPATQAAPAAEALRGRVALAAAIKQALPAHADREDQFAALLAPQADALVGEWIESIRELVNRAGSLEEIRDGLIDLYPDMDDQRLGELMSAAFSASWIAGMSDAKDESRG